MAETRSNCLKRAGSIAQYRQAATGGLQVLTQREHIYVVGSRVTHHLQNLIVGFTS